MDWAGRTVLVTGAGGFIGSHLAERLVELGARTRALVEYNSDGAWGWLDRSALKDDIEVFLGDIRDPENLIPPMRSTDVVFHLAALISIPYSYRSPLSFVRTNVEGTLNVLQAALGNDVGLVVHTSTSEVYGTARYVPIDEGHPLQGQSPYAASKIGADQMAEAFHRSFGLPVTTLRPFNTYGPRQSARAVIPTIITQALTGTEVRLGNTSPTRDLTYVSDMVEAFVGVASCPDAIGEVVNVGTGREVSIADLAKMILRMTDGRAAITSDEQRLRPEGSEVERLLADSTKARSLLNWRPTLSLEEGLKRTVDWLTQNSALYKTGVYAV